MKAYQYFQNAHPKATADNWPDKTPQTGIEFLAAAHASPPPPMPRAAKSWAEPVAPIKPLPNLLPSFAPAPAPKSPAEFRFPTTPITPAAQSNPLFAPNIPPAERMRPGNDQYPGELKISAENRAAATANYLADAIWGSNPSAGGNGSSGGSSGYTDYSSGGGGYNYTNTPYAWMSKLLNWNVNR